MLASTVVGMAKQHPGWSRAGCFAQTGKPLGMACCAREQGVLKHAKIAKHVTIHGLRRTATDLLRHAAVDPVAAKAIIGHTTDRMREHYSTVNANETRDIGARVVSLVAGSAADSELVDQASSPAFRVRCLAATLQLTTEDCFAFRRAGEGIRTLDVNLGKVAQRPAITRLFNPINTLRPAQPSVR